MGYVDRLENAYRVVRINVAYELCVHEEAAFSTRPVLKRYVHGARTEVASAYAYLNNGSEPLAVSVRDLAFMYFFRELSDLSLLALIELSLVDSVRYNIVSELSACQMMQHESLLSRVYHRAVVQLFKLSCEIGLFGKIRQHAQNLVIYLLGRKIVRKSACHRHRVLLYALPGHDLFEIYAVP